MAARSSSEEIHCRPLSRFALDRIQAILTGQEKDPEAPHWTDTGEKTAACSGCQRNFTLFNRRHHCRICGGVFCTQCSSANIRLEEFQLGKAVLRSCHECHKAFTQAALKINPSNLHTKPAFSSASRSPHTAIERRGNSGSLSQSSFGEAATVDDEDVSSQLRTRRQTLPTDVRRMRVAPHESVSSYSDRKPAELSQSVEDKTLHVPEIAMRDVWLDMHASGTEALPVGTHRYRLRSYDACVPGNSIVDWLLRKHYNLITQRSVAIQVCQKLVDAGFLECCVTQRTLPVDGVVFHDSYVPYRLRNLSSDFTTDASALNSMRKADYGVGHVVDDDADSATVSALSLLRAEPKWLQDINFDDDSKVDLHANADQKSPTKASRLTKFERSVSTSALDQLHEVRREAQSLFYAVPSTITDTNSTKTAKNVETVVTALHDDHDLPKTDAKSVPPNNLVSSRSFLDEADENSLPVFAQPDEDAASAANAKKIFERLFMQRFDVMLQQQLTKYGLRAEWFSVIKTIAEEVAVRVKPNVRHRDENGEMTCKTPNILHYVHLKKLPGGTLTDCRILYGVAFSKHVVNKSMRKNIDRPAVCLYKAALEYHSENSLDPLEPALQHEFDYQSRLVSKITALKPDVLLVQHGVSRLAQEFLLVQEGVSLLQHVKPAVMQRLVRHTDAELIPQLGETETRSLVPKKHPRLGTCANFRVEEIQLTVADSNSAELKSVVKPLAIFDGCPAHAGCTILLRGENLPSNLVAVKQIMRLAILYSYNRHLEAAFLVSEYAQPAFEPETLVKVNQREPVRHGGMDFRDALQRVAVSLSPFVDIRRPFAESDDVQHAPYLRPFMPTGKFRSFWTTPVSVADVKQPNVAADSTDDEPNLSMRQQWDRQKSHSFDFLNRTLTQPAKSASVQTMLAQLRAHYAHNWRNGVKRERRLMKLKNANSARNSSSSGDGKKFSPLTIDCLDPFEHNRLTVLHSVYAATVVKPHHHIHAVHSNNSRAVFCVRPHIVDMNFYAESDVTLGQYINTITEGERNCATCSQPNDTHVHQFVHNGACIRITLQADQNMPDTADSVAQRRNTNSSSSKPVTGRSPATKEEREIVVMWSSCGVCRESTPIVRLGEEALMLSLAKYLELQFLAPSYFRRSVNTHCGHSLHHAHMHYFKKGNSVATVRFSSAGMKLIRYPTKTISLGSALAYNCATLLPTSSSSPSSQQKQGGLQMPTPTTNEIEADAGLSSLITSSRSRNKSFSNVYVETNADLVNNVHQTKPPQTITLVRNALAKQVEDVIVSGHGLYECINKRLQALHDACGALGLQAPLRFEALQFALQDEQRVFKERHEAIQVKLASPWLRHAGEFGSGENSRPSSRTKRISSTATVAELEQDEIGVIFGGGQTSTSSSSTTGDVLKRIPSLVSTIADADTPPIVNRSNSTATLLLADDELPAPTNSSPRNHDDRNAMALRTVMKIECALFDLKKFICEAARTWTSKLPEWLQQRKKEERDERKQIRHTATVGGELARLISTTSGNSNSGGMSVSSVKASKMPTNIADACFGDEVVEQNLVRAKSSPFLPITEPDSAAGAVLFDTFHDEESLYNDETGNDSVSTGGTAATDHVSQDSGLHLRSLAEEAEANCGSSVASTTPTNYSMLQTMVGEASEISGRGSENSPLHSRMQSLWPLSDESIRNSHAAAQTGLSAAVAATVPLLISTVPAAAVNMKTLTSLVNAPVPFPFPASQHYLLPPTHERYVAPILDDEPSSLIAFALCSAEYNKLLQALIDENESTQPHLSGSSATKPIGADKTKLNANIVLKPASVGGSIDGVSHRSVASAAAIAAGMLTFDVEPTPVLQRKLFELEPEAAVAAAAAATAPPSTAVPSSPHIEIQFSDPSTRFFCRIYFAREFHKLRQAVLGDGEDRFVRSLSRSVRWHASGGKSGSEFSKSVDERFVIKQLSKIEIGSFLDFGPSYISYVLQRLGNDAEKSKLPLALAKIVGVYKIGLRNAHTGTAFKQDVLVMENLFYKRSISQVYDLKGSLRNRLADVGEQSSSSASAALSTTDQVLLDENYLRLSIDAPLYVRPEVKRCLNAVIERDSQFLMSHSVMDYSLLVGVDDTRHELVVGIIDYVRTFTWHKRIEMMVKSSGLLGGQGRMPTIVTPNLYQARFCEAMQRYFLPVPDKWYRFGGCGDAGENDMGGDDFAVDDNSEEAARRRVEDSVNHAMLLSSVGNNVRR